ncbi:SURF1 family protein [Kiloniella antarctica]|uniref:SURF1-like protein n=1 Tax=Kiloniella antarctica TaxID=1550907 RepID=A0ABW5BE23_9PROT
MTKGVARKFQPTFWPTIFSIFVIILALCLGTWQIYRMEWKEDQILLRTERSIAEPFSFVERFPGEVENPKADEFLKVWVEGEFQHDKEFYLGARSLDRRLGLQVVTPLLMNDGREILINRGFILSELKDPSTRQEAQVTGTVKVEGLIRIGGWKGYEFVRPQNDPVKNFWFYVDNDVMSKTVDLNNPVKSVYLDAGPDVNPGGYPLGGQTRIELVNNHLTYVLTWFSMALILAVIYFIFHYRPVLKKEDE